MKKDIGGRTVSSLKNKLETTAYLKGDNYHSLNVIAQELRAVQSRLTGLTDSIKKVTLPDTNPKNIREDGITYDTYEQLHQQFTECENTITSIEKKYTPPTLKDPSKEITDKISELQGMFTATKEQILKVNEKLTELYHKHKKAEIRIALSKGYRGLHVADEKIRQAQGLTRVEQKLPLLREAKEQITVIDTHLDRNALLRAAKQYPDEQKMIKSFSEALSASEQELQKAITGHMSSADTKVQREITEIKEHAEKAVARILKEERGDVNALEMHSAHWFHESTREELRKIVEDYIKIDELLINHLSVDSTLREEFEDTLNNLAELYAFKWKGKKDIKKLGKFFEHVKQAKAPAARSKKKLETFRDLYEDVKRLAYITQEVLVRANNATDQLQTSTPKKKGLFGRLFRRGGSQ